MHSATLKQHLKVNSRKVKQHRGWAEKKRCFQKKTFNYIYSKKFYLDFICMVLFYLIDNYGLKLSRIYNDFLFIKLIQGNFTFRFF